MGGFWSCGQDENHENNPTYGNAGAPLIDLFQAARDALRRRLNGGPLGEIITCHALDPTRGVFYTSNLDGPQRVEEVTNDELVQHIERLVRNVPNPELVIVGHSYGGWTSMLLAQHLDSAIPIRDLVTLDPISKIGCTPDRFLAALVSQAPALECTQSPRDFTPAELRALADRVDSWTNYYEVDAAYLHADPIVDSPKIENIQKSYDNPAGTLAAHVLIAADPVLNQDIVLRFEHALFL